MGTVDFVGEMALPRRRVKGGRQIAAPTIWQGGSVELVGGDAHIAPPSMERVRMLMPEGPWPPLTRGLPKR